MHFLKELVETPELKEPFKNHLKIHRHFYRYSKGEFIGPAIKISQTSTKITLKGSHEYEDLIQEIVAHTITKPEFEIKGTLITGQDISEVIRDLGFEWDLKKSTGKTKNYKAKFQSKTNKESFIECIKTLRPHSYLLASFNVSPTCKVTTKKTVPQPSKKKVEDDEVNKRIQFCYGVIKNTESNLKTIIDLVIPDFISDLPEKWKKITLTNNYSIKDIILPEDVENWALKRIMAIRKGRMTRTIDVDGEIIEKQYNIVV